MGKLNKIVYPRYWKRKDKVDRMGLNFKNVLYRIKLRTLKVQYSMNMEKSILGTVFIELIKALLIVLPIMIIEYYLKVYSRKINIYDGLKSVLQYDYPSFIAIVSALLGISGVFLGLFYSNMASVFTSRYAEMPREISILFENELVSNKYTRLLINYMLINSLFLFLNIIGFKTSIFAALVICFMTIRIVCTFSLLGKRAFQFSDFFAIADTIYKPIRENIKNATIYGFFHTDRSFQNHYYERTNNNLNLLDSLASIGMEENQIKKKSISDFMKKNLVLLQIYTENKKYMHFNSLWFEKIYEYRSWFMLDDSSIEIAVRNGIHIRPTESNDKNWFERKLLKLNHKILKQLTDVRSLDYTHNYIITLSDWLENLIDIDNVDFWYSEIKSLTKSLQDFTLKHYDEVSDIDNILALVDSVNYLNMSLFFAIKKEIDILDIEANKIKITNGSLTDKTKLMKLNIPMSNSEWFANLFDKIGFEDKVEGKIITPDWYIVQNIASKYNEYIIKYIEIILDLYEDQISTSSKVFMDSNKYICASLCISNENEAFNKVLYFLNEIKDKLCDIEKYRIENSLPWKEINLSDCIERLKNKHNQVFVNSANCIVNLFQTNYSRKVNVPDIFGYVYNNYCDFIMESIITQSIELFTSSYNQFLKLCTIEELRIVSELGESAFNWAIINAKISPIIDFMEISGYAIYLSELTDDARWKNTVASVCDQYFNLLENKEQHIIRWISLANIKKELPPAMYNRDLIHTTWKIRFQQMIVEKKFIKFKVVGPVFNEIVDSDNPVVKKFYYSRDFGFMYDFREVFLACYLNKCIADKDKKYIGRLNERDKWEVNSNE
jgi:hypothetical protein